MSEIEKEQKRKELDVKFDGGICVHMRGDIHMMLKDGAVLPPETTADINAYHAECRLLDILRNAGYVAEYDLETERPVALRITIPAGKDKNGYPDKDEHLTVSTEKGHSTIRVGFKLTEPSTQ